MFLEGFSPVISNPGTQSSFLVEADVHRRALGWHYLDPCFSQGLLPTPQQHKVISGNAYGPRNLARQTMDRFALLVTLLSMGPIAIADK